MTMGSITLKGKSLATFQVNMAKLRAAIPKAGKSAMRTMSDNYRKQVVKNYMSGGAPSTPLAPGTLERRAQGKLAGKSPGAAPQSGVMPFGKSLYSLVQIARSGGKGTSTTRVFLKPGVPMSRGATSETVGAINEFGETHTMVADVSVRTFLRALAMGVAGQDIPVNAKSTESIVITIRIPPRPVWLPAFQTLLAKHPKEYANLFAKSLNRRNTGFKITF